MPSQVHTPLTVRNRRDLRLAVCGLEVVVAVGAIVGAVGMLADNAIGLPDSWLAAVPFPTWRWPAVLLLATVAVPTTVAAVGELRRAVWAPMASTLAGTMLVIWIVVQVVLVRQYFVLQPLFAMAGLAILLLSARLHRGGPPRRPAGRRVGMRRL